MKTFHVVVFVSLLVLTECGEKNSSNDEIETKESLHVLEKARKIDVLAGDTVIHPILHDQMGMFIDHQM